MADVIITPRMNDTYDVNIGTQTAAWFLFGVTGREWFVDDWAAGDCSNVSPKVARKIVKAMANSPLEYLAPSHI